MFKRFSLAVVVLSLSAGCACAKFQPFLTKNQWTGDQWTKMNQSQKILYLHAYCHGVLNALAEVASKCEKISQEQALEMRPAIFPKSAFKYIIPMIDNYYSKEGNMDTPIASVVKNLAMGVRNGTLPPDMQAIMKGKKVSVKPGKGLQSQYLQGIGEVTGSPW